MSGLGMDRHTKRRKGERRGGNRKGGTDEDLKYSVSRVKKALRNSPTQILRAEDTRALQSTEHKDLRRAGFVSDGNRFLHIPMDAARKAMMALRDIWGGSGLD
jgi:hypothetical protein